MPGFNRAPTYRPICRTCPRSRRADQLLCLRCWALVPADLQKAVYDLDQPKAARQSLAYLQAAAAAVQAVEAALAASRTATTETGEGT